LENESGHVRMEGLLSTIELLKYEFKSIEDQRKLERENLM
jgi:hypothetical protein